MVSKQAEWDAAISSWRAGREGDLTELLELSLVDMDLSEDGEVEANARKHFSLDLIEP